MTRIRQWPVRRPRWAALLAAGTVLAAAAGIAYSLAAFYVAPLVLLAGWRFSIASAARQYPRDARLRLDDRQRWSLEAAGTPRPLQLLHAWPAFAWISLRFNDPAVVHPKESMVELTVWKSSVSVEAWRQLRMQIARQAAAPPEPLAPREAG